MSTPLPMFPLGSVLLPGMVLPLHVFEPRYRQLMHDIGPRGEFGVVLIERGSEVGGGDQRVDVGTVAKIVDAEELEDGRWLAVGVGTRRFRVRRWLEDDPYPRAEVDAWPDRPAELDLTELHDRLDRVLDLASQLDPDIARNDLAGDAQLAVYQAAIMAPLGPVDRLRLLRTESVGERASLLLEQLADLEEVLRFQVQAS